VRRWLIDRGGLLALVTVALYIWLAPHHVVDGDNAEFATLSVTGGPAHPSGYPLYVLYLRALSWLPGASAAHTSAIATALLGGVTVLVLHAACRAWGAKPVAATCAVALFGSGPVVLRVVTEAEVFALNNLVVASVLWLAAIGGPVRGVWRAGLLGLVAGLGLADHLTCVLVAPVGIVGVVRGAREGRAPLAIAAAAGGLALGLVPYVYLFVAPQTPLSWGPVRGLDGLIGMVTRRDYGGPTAFRPGVQGVGALDGIVALGKTLGRAYLWLPAVAGLGIIATRIARPRAETRAAWSALALAWLVAGPVLVMRFNVPPTGLGLYVCQRFHMMPAVLLAIGVAQVFQRVPERLGAIIASAGVVGLAALSLGYVGRVHSPAVETSARNMLASLPPGAVVIHGQDELHAVPGYVQTVLGERRDVTIVTWPLMTLGWYRERVAGQGIVSGPGTGSPEVRLVEALLARGRPVFVDRLQRDVIAALPSHPYGILIRVLPREAQLPSVREVFELNEALFAHFALDYPRPGPDDEFATEVHERYRATWEMIATMLERSGDRERAALAAEHARALGPH
jgi:hypothetical protein